MWKGYHKFFVSQYGDGTTGRRRRGVMSTLAALLKEAVQMYRAMKSVWVDQKTLRVVAT